MPRSSLVECFPKEDVFALETGTNPRVERYIKSRHSVNGQAAGRVAERREFQYIRPDEWQHTIEADQNAEIKDRDSLQGTSSDGCVIPWSH